MIGHNFCHALYQQENSAFAAVLTNLCSRTKGLNSDMFSEVMHIVVTKLFESWQR